MQNIPFEQSANSAGSGTTPTVTTGGTAESGLFTRPSINLPRNGGAFRGMGEKFAAHPATGIGSIN